MLISHCATIKHVSPRKRIHSTTAAVEVFRSDKRCPSAAREGFNTCPYHCLNKSNMTKSCSTATALIGQFKPEASQRIKLPITLPPDHRKR